jgi:hypothetical protein
MKYTEHNGEQVKFEDLCHIMYQGFGQQTVIAFCESIGWDQWLVCDACETESPVQSEFNQSTCLVCGSIV